MMLTTHQGALLARFFPQTGSAWQPLRWLEICAGLTLWQFKAYYRHFRHEIEVRFEVMVPASENGQMKAVARDYVWPAEEFASYNADYIRMRVCEAARAFAGHEVMESIKIDGRHYFADALALDHGEDRE